MQKAKITNFTDLNTWKKGHELVLGVYLVSEKFPSIEQFGLSSQMKRAVVSVTSNIAEGFSRRTQADKVHFYHMALGSCTEVQNQLLIAKDLGFIENEVHAKMSDLSVEVHKLLNGLIKSMKVSQL